MTAVLPCLRCGHEGVDVAAVLVDLEAEAKLDGSGIRDIEVVQEIQHRHITERVRSTVPERYGTEWRCRDRAACARRYRELSAPPEPMAAAAASAPDEEEVPWWA
jgi:hypothetical protein